MSIIRIFVTTIAFQFIFCSLLYATSEIPLYIKYRYEKQTGRKWHDASYERQQEFMEEIRDKQRKEKNAQRIKDINKDRMEKAKDRKIQAKKNRRMQRERKLKQIRLARERQADARVRKLQRNKVKMFQKLKNANNRQKSSN